MIESTSLPCAGSWVPRRATASGLALIASTAWRGRELGVCDSRQIIQSSFLADNGLGNEGARCNSRSRVGGLPGHHGRASTRNPHVLLSKNLANPSAQWVRPSSWQAAPGFWRDAGAQLPHQAVPCRGQRWHLGAGAARGLVDAPPASLGPPLQGKDLGRAHSLRAGRDNANGRASRGPEED